MNSQFDPNTERAALVLAGHGQRSWASVGSRWGERASGEAWVVPMSAVHARHVPSSLHQPRRAAKNCLGWIQRHLSAGFGVAGHLGYELGAAIHAELPPALTTQGLGTDLVAFVPELVRCRPLPEVDPWAGTTLGFPQALRSQRPQFLAAVHAALEKIAQGELYQINLTVGFDLPISAEIAELTSPEFAALLLATQPVPFAGVYQGASGRIVSGSMEQFVAVVGRSVRTRPIKGTAARQHQAEDDLAAAAALSASAKERAENTMIVDMARNDLSKVAEVGTVKVPVFLEAEPYETL